MVALENAGMIVYDIPDGLRTFGNYLRKVLRRAGALPVNLSVYFVNWADVPRINEIIGAAKKKYAIEIADAVQNLGGHRPLRVNILKFDNATAPEALQMAREGLSWHIAALHASLRKRLAKMQEEGEAELPKRVQVILIKGVLEAEAMAMSFRLMEDVGVALDTLREAVVAQINAEVATKYLRPSAVGVVA